MCGSMTLKSGRTAHMGATLPVRIHGVTANLTWGIIAKNGNVLPFARRESLTSSFWRRTRLQYGAIDAVTFTERDSRGIPHQFPTKGSIMVVVQQGGRFAVITRPAGKDVATVHSRQPVMMSYEQAKRTINR